jgi:hypothetical protein
MRRKLLIAILSVVIVSQLPFAYRRYRLGRLQNAIQQLASQRVPPPETGYRDYAGVIHVHSFLGGHATGTFAEIVSAAKSNQLDFVIMTEHPQADFDTSSMTLNGPHGGVLFVNGNEVATSDGDRLLLIPGSTDASSFSAKPTRDIVDHQRASGGLSIAAYPTESSNWQATGVDGFEVYNLFSNARAANPALLFFDGLWSFGRYADLMFADFFARPDANLKLWDQAIDKDNRRSIATAGNDAHSNIGLSLVDDSGKQWLGVKLDPYDRSFRVVRTHVLVKKDLELTRESLLAALASGHVYVSFDIFGDPKGFSFRVAGQEQKIMGDEVAFVEGMRLIASAPVASRVVLYRDGSVLEDKLGSTVQFAINSKGVYRVEAYLEYLPAPARGKPWVISNPIYVR